MLATLASTSKGTGAAKGRSSAASSEDALLAAAGAADQTEDASLTSEMLARRAAATTRLEATAGAAEAVRFTEALITASVSCGVLPR